MTHVRTPGKAYDSAGRHTGPGEWLAVIHEVNRIVPGTFGAPLFTGEWWAGGHVEEYADARVLHRPDGSVSVISKTEHGAALLAEAARFLWITVQDGPGESATLVTRGGEVRQSFDSGDPVKDQNDAFKWLMHAQGQSVDWAVRYEGWRITRPEVSQD